MTGANNLMVTLTVDDFFSRLETTIDQQLSEKLKSLQEKKEETLPELLTRKQVAEYLSISLTTVDTLSRDGVLTKHYVGGSPRFKREEIKKVSEIWEPYQRVA